MFESFGVNLGRGDAILGIIHSKGIFEGVKHYFNGKYELLWITVSLSIMLLIFYGFVIYGIFTVIKRIEEVVVLGHLLLLLSLLYFFITGGAASTPRFRIPMEPFLCIYATVGIFSIVSLCRKGLGRAVLEITLEEVKNEAGGRGDRKTAYSFFICEKEVFQNG